MPAKAPDYEVKAANTQSLQCLAKYAAELDDKRTDVNTIAKAVANSCSRERANFISVATQGQGPLDLNTVRNRIYSNDIEAATFYLLSSRAKK